MRRSRCQRHARGQALVEFALVFPIFAAIIFGLIALGIYVYTASALNQTTREAARYGSVASWAAECSPDVSPKSREGCIRETALGRLAGVGRAGVTVTITCERLNPNTNVVGAVDVESCRTGDTLIVAASSPVNLLSLSLSASGTTRMTVN